MTNIAV